MKKPYLIRILKLAALLIPIAAMVLLSQYFLFYHADYNTERIENFYYEEENSLDVVFIGASEIYSGFSPGYAYENHGFTSYLYAIGSNKGSLYKAQLTEILSRQNPGLIFMEVSGFLDATDEEVEPEEKLRVFTENIPMSANKLRTIFTYGYEDKLSCLIPFIKYHGDWQKLSELPSRISYKLNKEQKPSLLKGMRSITVTDTQEVLFDIRQDSTAAELTPRAEACLRELLEFCREQQLENIVFIKYPIKYVDEYRYQCHTRANRVGQILEEYGFSYLDLDQAAEEIGIDYTSDYRDPDHLNVFGMTKVTEYLGNWITNQYALSPASRTAENEAHWESCAGYAAAYLELGKRCYREGLDRKLYEYPEFMEELDQILSEMSG